MTDYTWPDDLSPYQQEFRLQPHTGGSESPFSRQSKIYGLSAPRWISSMSFRGGYDGTADQGAFGPRLDALIAKLKGRQNRVAIYDFRRPAPRADLWPASVGNSAASLGATSIVITGLPPGTPVFNGDYIGGDGRPHIICDDAFGAVHTVANSSGQATVSFEPPLKAAISSNAATFLKATGIFRLTDDDAGSNGTEVGDLQTMTLNFVEDLA